LADSADAVGWLGEEGAPMGSRRVRWGWIPTVRASLYAGAAAKLHCMHGIPKVILTIASLDSEKNGNDVHHYIECFFIFEGAM